MLKLFASSLLVFVLLVFWAPAQKIKGGKEIFLYKCTNCHGANGTKHLFGAKDLRKSIIADTEIVKIISNGKSIMPSFKTQFTKDEIQLIMEYVKTLRK